MGFFSRLFSGKSKEQEKMEEIFERVLKLLNNDAMQLNYINPVIKPMLDNSHIDKIPDGIGEFGRDPRNPIPCNGPLGEITYLSKLVIKFPKGVLPFTFHRLGSLDVKEIGRCVDKYEIMDYNGVFHDILFLDFYHTTKSKICPKGYDMEDRCSGYRGTNWCNNEFPYNQYQKVMECAKIA